MLGRDSDRLNRKKCGGDIAGQELTHARQIGLANHHIGGERQMRAVLFGGGQRQHRDPSRRGAGANVGPVDVSPVAGRKDSHKA